HPHRGGFLDNLKSSSPCNGLILENAKRTSLASIKTQLWIVPPRSGDPHSPILLLTMKSRHVSLGSDGFAV
ncbi:MAG: hypothetical protein ACKO7A_08300, partial [Microcystis sp.]